MTYTRHILRRLLLAVPTLLGICLVTFALVHLAPGDPLDTGAEGAVSGGAARAGETLRRQYFLDLPVFYNPRPRGVEGRVERLAGDVGRSVAAGKDPSSQVARLRSCGTACLAPLARLLPGERGPAARSLWRAVEGVRADHPGLGPGQGDARGWLRAVQPSLEPGVLGRLASDLGAPGEQGPRAERALLAHGTAALPAVMGVLLAGEGPAATAAARVAGRLAAREGARPAGGDLTGGDLQRWQEWWFRERREHAVFSASERALGRVTETRFGKWLGRLLTLRLGTSTRWGRPVSEMLGETLPVTLALGFLSLSLAFLLGVPLGVHAACRAGSLPERTLTALTFLLYSMPSFWVGTLLILLLGGVGLLDWFPIYGLASPGLEDARGWAWLADRLWHLVLPVTCLTYGSLAVVARHQRSAMLEVLGQDYIRTARAKGLPERTVLFKHALPNALLPTATLLGLQLPYLIGGSVIVERIFNIPGMGLLTFQAFLDRDYPVIMAVSVLAAVLTLAGLLLADLLYALLDPRITLEGRP